MRRDKVKERDFDRNDYETPKWFFDKLNAIFDFQTDLAASEDNRLCSGFLDKECNSLEQRWHGFDGFSFLNPPYSPLKPWILKTQTEAARGAKIVVLAPPIICTKYFSEIMEPAEIWFLVGRINFCYKGEQIRGNMNDSCLYVYDRDRKPCVKWVETRTFRIIRQLSPPSSQFSD